MGGRETDDDDTHKRHTDNKATYTKKNLPPRLSTKFRTLALSESVAHRMEPLPLTLEHLNPELHVAIGSALADDPASLFALGAASHGFCDTLLGGDGGVSPAAAAENGGR